MMKPITPLISSLPHSQDVRESKENFLDLIGQATRVDHQIYTEEKLTPFEFSINAALPAISNLVFSPYYLVSNLFKLAKKELDEKSVLCKEAKMNITISVINFINSCLTPLLYLSYASIVVVEVHLFVPVLFCITIASCLLGLAKNSYKLIKHHQFLKKFNTKPLSCISTAKKHVKKSDNALFLEECKKLSTYLKNDTSFPKELLTQLEKLTTNPVDLTKSKKEIKTLFSEIERVVLIHLFENLESTYFLLTDKQKQDLTTESIKNYETLPYPEALFESFKKIQNKFKEKKMLLADRIQPDIAIDFQKKYQGYLTTLRDNNAATFKPCKKEAKTLFFEITKKVSTKKDILFTNIALSILGIATCVIGSFFHVGLIVSVSFFIVSLLIYNLNHLNIHGNLQRTTKDFDWKNCLPNWVVSIGNYFFQTDHNSSKPLSQITATDITHQVRPQEG